MTGPQLSFTWSARREGNLGWVLESCGPYFNEFGPMPSHVVPAFIQARHRLIAMRMEEYGAAFVLESLPTTVPKSAQETHHEQTTQDIDTTTKH